MAGRRIERLNEQLRREITDILRGEARDPRIGVVTITRAETAPDLSFARVFFTTLSQGAELEDTSAGLAAAASFIRSELGRRLRIRRAPEIRFEVDHGLEHARRIEQLLSEVRQQSAPASDEEAE